MEVTEIGESELIPEGVSVCRGQFRYDRYNFVHGKHTVAIDVPRNPKDESVDILIHERKPI